MPAKCPLCFHKLDPTQQLQRVCLTHKDRTQTFAFDIDRKDMFCPVKTCENPRSIQTGVFSAAHRMRGEESVLEGRRRAWWCPRATRWTATAKSSTCSTGCSACFSELAEIEPKAPEMWFPLHMFRTVNWYSLDERQGQQIGATIRLAGAKNAGKTVLATMALVPYGYAQPQPTPTFRVENFVVCVARRHRAGAAAAGAVPAGSAAVQHAARSAEHAGVGGRHAAHARQRQGRFFPGQRREPQVGGRDLEVRAEFEGAVALAAVLRHGRRGQREAGGEAQRTRWTSARWCWTDRSLGFFNALTPPNAKTASERLATIAANRKCLIVTKLDLIKQDLLLPEERELIAKLRDRRGRARRGRARAAAALAE